MKKFIYLLKVGVIFTMFSLLSVAKETLIIGTNAEFAPFEYLDNGKVVGFDIDLINEIGKKLDLNIKIENLSFDGLLPALQAKKVDLIIAGMTATEDRKKFVDFTDDYFIAKQVLIVEDVSSAPQNFEDLKGKKVGTILGYTGDLIISKIPEIKSEKYNAPFGAIMALKSGKIDAVIL
ncbi:MAG: transporter substrate-binding domain-containing protein, partial [Cetobacterium sp.]